MPHWIGVESTIQWLSNQKSEWQRDYEALREATRKVAVTAAE